jgi:hypothetical protein
MVRDSRAPTTEGVQYRSSRTGKCSGEILIILLLPSFDTFFCPQQQGGLPLIQSGHAVKLSNGICEFVDVSTLRGLSQILHSTHFGKFLQPCAIIVSHKTGTNLLRSTPFLQSSVGTQGGRREMSATIQDRKIPLFVRRNRRETAARDATVLKTQHTTAISLTLHEKSMP